MRLLAKVEITRVGALDAAELHKDEEDDVEEVRVESSTPSPPGECCVGQYQKRFEWTPSASAMR